MTAPTTSMGGGHLVIHGSRRCITRPVAATQRPSPTWFGRALGCAVASDVARGKGRQSADFLTPPLSAADSAALDTQLQRTLQPLIDELSYETHRELPETIRYPQTSVLLEQDCRRELAFHFEEFVVMVRRVSRYLLVEILSNSIGSEPSYFISDEQIVVVHRSPSFEPWWTVP